MRRVPGDGTPIIYVAPVRVAALSDPHGHLPRTPECDVLVIAGDVTPTDDHDPAFQARWLAESFAPWLAEQPATEIVGVAGNHDFVFEQRPDLVPELPWTYLQDAGAEVGGRMFWGSPWTPWFFDWAFNAPRGDTAEVFLRERYAPVPDGADVLVLHGPPAGLGDRTSRGEAAGSNAALELIDRVRPKLVVYGHIHEARGRFARGDAMLVNASHVDLGYEPYDEPIGVFEV